MRSAIRAWRSPGDVEAIMGHSSTPATLKVSATTPPDALAAPVRPGGFDETGAGSVRLTPIAAHDFSHGKCVNLTLEN